MVAQDLRGWQTYAPCQQLAGQNRIRSILTQARLHNLAVRERPLAQTSNSRRKVLSPLQKEAHARSLEIERRFAENADKDMRAMCEEGHVEKAVDYIELLHKGGLRLSLKSYAFLLQECVKIRALDEGKKVHALLITNDIELDVTLRNHLLSLYVKCDRLKEAKLMFHAMGPMKDVVSWTIIINACAQCGQFVEAVKLYHTMVKRRALPNKITFICLLKACRQPDHLPTAQLLHEHIVKRLLQGDPYVGGALVDLYFRFGDVKSARKAFYEIRNKNPYLWNLLVAGLVKNGKSKEALKVYHHMRFRHRVEPTEATWVHVIKACSDRGQLCDGRFAHFRLCIDGIVVDGSIGEELVLMYANCGSLVDARHVFDQLHFRPLSLWLRLIEAYTACEEHNEAARLTLQMQEYKKQLESGQINNIFKHEENEKIVYEIPDSEDFMMQAV